MKNKKICSLAILLILATILCTGCLKISSFQKSIYNDDSKISETGDSYSFVSISGNFINNELAIGFKGFSGKKTVWKLQAKENCTFDIDCNTGINSGKFKICIVDADKKVSTIAEGSKIEKLTIDIKAGTNYLKIVGYEANGKLNLIISENEKVTVTQIND